MGKQTDKHYFSIKEPLIYSTDSLLVPKAAFYSLMANCSWRISKRRTEKNNALGKKFNISVATLPSSQLGIHYGRKFPLLLQMPCKINNGGLVRLVEQSFHSACEVLLKQADKRTINFYRFGTIMEVANLYCMELVSNEVEIGRVIQASLSQWNKSEG